MRGNRGCFNHNRCHYCDRIGAFVTQRRRSSDQGGRNSSVSLTHPHFPSPFPSRWEAVQVHVGELRLALCSLRRAHSSLQEAHGRQALPVRRLLALLLPVRSPCPAHEKTPELAAFAHTHTPPTKQALSWHVQSLPQLPRYMLPDYRVTPDRDHSSSWVLLSCASSERWRTNALLMKQSGTILEVL